MGPVEISSAMVHLARARAGESEGRPLGQQRSGGYVGF